MRSYQLSRGQAVEEFSAVLGDVEYWFRRTALGFVEIRKVRASEIPTYVVSGEGCSCPAGQFRGECKHRAALAERGWL